MIDGITVLHSYEVVTKTAFSWPGFWVGLIIGVVVSLLLSFILENELSDFLVRFCIYGVLFGGFLGVIGGHAICPKPVEYESRWEVIVNETVSMNEFYNRYEVVEQRGEIYVIREKEIEHD